MMKKNVLLRTNVFICTVIVLGFLLTSTISFYSNNGIFEKDIEHITNLTSEGIYHRIDSIFTKPVNISLTMANDSLLKTFLQEENVRGEDEAFIQTMRDYLQAYQTKYSYDSVFLVSAQTNKYYHYSQGIDRVLTEDNPENDWYYAFLENSREYSLNIDNDEAQSADNGITIFINCKIYAPDGDIMGVVGVGFSVDTLQKIFREYEESFNLRAYLVDENGIIEISTTKTGYVETDLFQDCGYSEYKADILSNQGAAQSLWYSTGGERGFLVASYIPNLKWHLIIENDTAAWEAQLNRQFFLGVFIILLVVGAVLLVITRIIHRYNAQIISLAIENEKAHRTVFQTETEKLYENIYEIDITHNRPAGEDTESYFESLGASKSLGFDETLKVVAGKQIKEEYREGYLNTFSTANVLRAYEEGRESLRYDFMTTNDGGNTYYWMRITARIFCWKEDQSVRMLVYRQNIDQEKQWEVQMAGKMMRDSLSGLYNKAATQELISNLLKEQPWQSYAFFILDIDNFKVVNDTCGHAVGDQVITDFAGKVRGQFRDEDIIGRIGGDEFVVFVPVPDEEWVVRTGEKLAKALQYEFTEGTDICHISASIGIAIAPEGGRDFHTLYKNADVALYKTKEKGKRGFTVY